ncbi:hypothetical protein IT072_21055 (plasmid) [Leifsonia sp. ZF2019]|nr:hypothetical protein IT072_21055 [Leifsonia sp. ZF2019]
MEREAFFVLFEECKSTAVAARELGLNPATCAQWVRKAGLDQPRLHRWWDERSSAEG